MPLFEVEFDGEIKDRVGTPREYATRILQVNAPDDEQAQVHALRSTRGAFRIIRCDRIAKAQRRPLAPPEPTPAEVTPELRARMVGTEAGEIAEAAADANDAYRTPAVS